MIDITELQIGNLVKKVGENQPLPVLVIDSEKELAELELKGTITVPHIDGKYTLWNDAVWAQKIEPLPITHDLLWCLGVEVIVLRGDGYSAYRFGEFHTLIGTKEGSCSGNYALDEDGFSPVLMPKIPNYTYWTLKNSL